MAKDGPEEGGEDTESRLAVARELFEGRYEVREMMSWNGLALMFRASEPGRDVAVAALPIDADGAPEAVEQFMRHAELLELVDDPHLVSVTDSGVQHGVPYLEFDYFEGRTLRSVLDEGGAMEDDRIRRLAGHVLHALEEGHTRGIHHWDLTPNNVLLVGEDDEERALVIGFGIAPLLRSANPDRITAPTGKGSGPKATHYLAPEVRLGSRADRRADFYSVGALIAHMATGEVPPRDRPEVEHKSVFHEVVSRATTKDPAERYRSSEEMAAALNKSARHEISVMTTMPADPNAPPPPVIAPPPSPLPPPPAKEAADRVPVPSVPPAALGSLPPAPGRSELLRPQSALSALWDHFLLAPLGVRLALPLVLVLGVGGMLFIKGRGGSGMPPDAIAALRDAGAPTDADAGTGEDEEVAADAGRRDLLTESPLPEVLATAHKKAQAGEQLDRSELTPLYRYCRENEEDVRGHLVLAHAFMDLEWYSDAMDRYQDAFDVDPMARNDARMVRDLIDIVLKTQSLHRQAATMVERIYGPWAIPAIKEAMGRAPNSGVERLEALLLRLEQTEAPSEGGDGP